MSEAELARHKLQRIYREVLMGALRDLGYGESDEVDEVERWVKRDSFFVVCEIAKWDSSWVVDLFESVKILPDRIRRTMTKQCLDTMRGVIRISDPDNIDQVIYGVSPDGKQSTRTAGGSADEFEMKYIGHSPNIMSKRSKEMHERAKVARESKSG